MFKGKGNRHQRERKKRRKQEAGGKGSRTTFQVNAKTRTTIVWVGISTHTNGMEGGLDKGEAVKRKKEDHG